MHGLSLGVQNMTLDLGLLGNVNDAFLRQCPGCCYFYTTMGGGGGGVGESVIAIKDYPVLFQAALWIDSDCSRLKAKCFPNS